MFYVANNATIENLTINQFDATGPMMNTTAGSGNVIKQIQAVL